LQPRLEDSWFARALIPRLEMQKRVSRKQAIAVMAQAAGVDQKQANKLSMLVDWLEFAGLVQVDESDMVSLPRTPAAEPTRPTKTEHQTADREQRRTTAPTTTSQGGVNLNFAVRVDITELAGWDAARISALFDGVSRVLAAKAGLPTETTPESGQADGDM
jgi:hypothetical protein